MLVKKNSGFPVVSNLVDDLFKDWTFSNFSESNTTLPAVNIKENNDEFIVEVAAPGMEKKDFKIDYEDGDLTISSEKSYENEETEDNYTRKEYSYQTFKRSFSLPKNMINSDKITASYKKGELLIKIPKLEIAKQKPSRLIEVL